MCSTLYRLSPETTWCRKLLVYVYSTPFALTDPDLCCTCFLRYLNGLNIGPNNNTATLDVFAELAVTVQGRIAITLGYNTSNLVAELINGSLATNFGQNAFLRLDDFTAIAKVWIESSGLSPASSDC